MKTKVLSAWESIRTEAQRQVIRRHAEMIYRAGHEALTEKRDREDLEERFREVMEKLGARV